jgi:hypothetical protein
MELGEPCHTPKSGDLHRGFFIAPGRCFRMIYSAQLQATHCYEPPAWKGIWKDRLGPEPLRRGVPGARAEGQPRTSFRSRNPGMNRKPLRGQCGG